MPSLEQQMFRKGGKVTLIRLDLIHALLLSLILDLLLSLLLALDPPSQLFRDQIRPMWNVDTNSQLSKIIRIWS